MATLDQVTQAVNAGSRARALIASQSPALLGQIRMPAYALDPNNSQPQVNPQQAPGDGGSQLGGDTGLAPDWQQDPATGIWYDANTGTPAPEWMQKQLGGQSPQIPTGQSTFGGAGVSGDQSFNIYNENTVSDSGGGALPSTMNTISLSDPAAGAMFGLDPQSYAQINALHDAGLLTDAQYRAALMGGGTGGGGGAGGGGGGSPYAAQQMDLQERQFAHNVEQDRLQNILAALSAVRQQQTLATQARDNAQAALINAAPNLNDGRQYFGGYEPGGPAQALADFSGYAFTPQPIHTVPITFNPAPVPVDPATQAILDRILGGQA